jgi:hypothetical protein
VAAAYLRIRFALGERPHWFWVSDWTPLEGGAARYKVLSKRRADGSLEVLVIEERAAGERRPLAQRDLEPGAAAGWLERWVEDLSESLAARFHGFDLRRIETEGEWRETAGRLGWISAA